MAQGSKKKRSKYLQSIKRVGHKTSEARKENRWVRHDVFKKTSQLLKNNRKPTHRRSNGKVVATRSVTPVFNKRKVSHKSRKHNRIAASLLTGKRETNTIVRFPSHLTKQPKKEKE